MSTMVALFRNPCSTASAISVTAADSSDSRRTPTQRVNEHLLGVQRVTKSQGCDASLL